MKRQLLQLHIQVGVRRLISSSPFEVHLPAKADRRRVWLAWQDHCIQLPWSSMRAAMAAALNPAIMRACRDSPRDPCFHVSQYPLIIHARSEKSWETPMLGMVHKRTLFTAENGRRRNVMLKCVQVNELVLFRPPVLCSCVQGSTR